MAASTDLSMSASGIRRGEALNLQWQQVDLKDRVRKVPLSDYSIGGLTKLVRYLSRPYVFVNTRTGKPWRNPDKAFRKACADVGVKIGFHDCAA